MRKLASLSLLLSLALSTGLMTSASAMGRSAAAKNPHSQAAPSQIQLAPSKADVQDIAAVQAILKDLLDASNRHDIDGVMKHYSPNFTSGDSLSLHDVRNLILDTWKMFPDIHYESQTLEVRHNGSWVAVESIDTSLASAKVDTSISSKPGTMKSRSRGMLYLHRTGKTWEIVSDATLYEKASIAYGPYENIGIDVETPEQVFAGEPYTAKVLVSVPPGNIAFATLSQEPLIYPQHSEKDKFRTLSSDKMDLERIFQANTSNNNEVVTATIGFTEIGQDDQERPTIALKGVLTVVKRVNVIPRSTHKTLSADEKMVRSTADGKVKLDAGKHDTPDDDVDMPSSTDSPSPDSAPSD